MFVQGFLLCLTPETSGLRHTCIAQPRRNITNTPALIHLLSSHNNAYYNPIMSVGFGFSAGDFIAALELVTTVVTALRDSGGSSAEYQALISQLYTLETALLRVKRLELDDSQHAEVVALRQAASQCQRTIDAFWEKIRKYQPSLREGGSGSRVKDAWRKVKWAVCKKDDLVKFKADLVGHTESIELLLTTVQMSTARIDGKKSENNHQTLIGKVQDSYFGCMQRMTVVMERVSTGIQQGQKLLEMTASIIQTNVQIFKIVLDIQHIITRIPGQVDRQQPVYLVDAICRHTPFHLEFITCAESLTAVLQNNFRGIGPGAEKIENGEFAIQDAGTGIDVDLTSNWKTCFYPGQKVEMSMVFTLTKATNGKSCPRCKNEWTSERDIDASYGKDVKW